ncbi:transcriptional regulator with XRE-family HTH domain [Paenarthrobacter nicotinovorans]|uniref:Transcriptional regulator with XRE-family HTH domain n=1 Tax=Paenarthrobacter nicotinovorans TaxID=29320 RepID=A0ABT9TSX0_PAENI|nr:MULTISPECIES: helix-turn-helix transcriptional regulator [Paenarthrobacter]MBP2394241.1 transcriptional regulator with XRE-family HTH domain [Paenarthrobacter nicotinovorans]MDQ0104767.1 transcriptional regulator with XRE-family HTH domain [Paenarthrobacter nicotinovorans]QOT21088.1 helix-turn-helix domain-containing protein [Paenarthrobacter sp. YJN-D]UKE99552.1 helix-turn-helix transcriptional regulator [Paenarthrobacter nicotinovorans]UKF04336.1 helix-turn-helix transcriptional regulator
MKDERRKELGLYLRTRRNQALRSDYGLPPVGRSRERGLRREEIAFLSGVSVTWYTWLEQGRDISPSRQVLESIARALHLSDTGLGYVLSLGGYASTIPKGPVAADAPAHVQRLLDALDPNPSYALSPDWGVAGWNRAYEALYPNIGTFDAADRNLLWLVFTDPYVRDLLPDWDVTSKRFLAEFRAETGQRLGDPDVAYQVERLKEASPEFQESWDRYDILGFESRERLFHHPAVGVLQLEHHQVSPSDRPDLHIVVYTPAPGSDAGEQMERLLETGRS